MRFAASAPAVRLAAWRLGVPEAASSVAAIPTAWAADRHAALTDRVERRLAEVVDRLPEPARAGCRRLVDAGGKRLRPDLALRCAAEVARPGLISGPNNSADGAGPDDGVGDDRGVVDAAVAVELMHCATLMHDDLIDNSAVRRGVATVHRQEGPGTAIVGGDALIARSWLLAAGGDPAQPADLGHALAQMCEGQLLEDRLRYRLDARLPQVLQVARQKTAVLLATACRLGARCAGATDAELRAYGSFGLEFGIALQLIDDVLDVVGDPTLMGKPAGSDLAAGLVTAPVVFGLTRADELRTLLSPQAGPDDRRRAVGVLVSSGGVSRTVALAEGFARRASRSLARVIPNVASAVTDLSQRPSRYVDDQLQRYTADRYRLGLGLSGDAGRGSVPAAAGSARRGMTGSPLADVGR